MQPNVQPVGGANGGANHANWRDPKRRDAIHQRPGGDDIRAVDNQHHQQRTPRIARATHRRVHGGGRACGGHGQAVDTNVGRREFGLFAADAQQIR